MTLGLGDLITEAAQKFEAVGIEDARREARLLAQVAFSLGMEKILGHPEWTPPLPIIAGFNQMVERRCSREPSSQIIGAKEFWGLNFKVTADTLTPRPDTETVIEAVENAYPDKTAPLRILDLGLGTGCLLFSLLFEYKSACGVGVDISSAALAVARENCENLGFSERAELYLGDWFGPVAGAFDVIVSNPPYIRQQEIAGLQPEVACHEPESALVGGEDGLDCYRTILGDALAHLPKTGMLFLEVGVGQATDVRLLGLAKGFKVHAIRRDLAGVERCIVLKP